MKLNPATHPEALLRTRTADPLLTMENRPTDSVGRNERKAARLSHSYGRRPLSTRLSASRAFYPDGRKVDAP